MVKKDLSASLDKIQGLMSPREKAKTSYTDIQLPVNTSISTASKSAKKKVTYSLDENVVRMLKHLAADLDQDMSSILEIIIQDFDHKYRNKEISFDDLVKQYS